MNNPQRHYVVLSAALLTLTYTCLLARLVSRAYVLRSLSVDDGFAAIAVIFGTLCTVMPIAAIPYGFGLDVGEQLASDVPRYQQYILVSSATYSVCNAFLKLSLLAFYIRLFKERVFVYITYVMMFMVIGIGIGSTIAVFTQCIPISLLWDPTATGSCFKIIAFYYANAALNVLTDIIIFVLPLKVLWNLQLPIQQRIGLCALFGLGGLICIASLIRLVTLKSIINSSNPTRDLVSPLSWSIVEIHVALFICCVPALKALLRRYLPGILGSLASTSGSRLAGYSTNYSRSRKGNGTAVPLSSIDRDTDKNTNRNWPANSVSVVGQSKESCESQERICPPDTENVIWQDITITVRSEETSEKPVTS